jgi:hypothetical protein
MAVPKWEEIEEYIKLDVKINQENLNRSVAKRMVSNHGDKAHLVALMNLHYEEANDGSKSDIDWRNILKFIDELQGENKCKD